MYRPRRHAAVLLLALTAACAPKLPRTYRLMSATLVPPGVEQPDLPRRVFVTEIRPGGKPCRADQQTIRLQPLKNKLRVTVDRDSLARQQQAGWLRNWAMRAEAEGCIEPGEGDRLAAGIVESVPLESMTAFRLVHANGTQSGYVDLAPETRVEVIAPLLKPSGKLTDAGKIERITGSGGSITVDLEGPPDLIGIERGWYGIQPKASGDGYKIVPLSAERRVNGTVEQSAAPGTNYFQFAPEAAFYRLFYKMDSNGVTAIVIAGKTRQDLDQRTKAVGAEVAACESSPGLCLLLPKKLGLNPYLVVNANGAEVTVPLGSTVRAAIRAAGIANPDLVASHLTVRRLYRGRYESVEFDSTKPDILNLTLMGLERLTW